ncbi:MAG: folylpolyglutamate synthase/dihydrofolate synthase family protein [Clostridia bacterium]|nr:folylpolyglutamate synthase/dihydrofolate synthase family protein [Clostridia bacterium]
MTAEQAINWIESARYSAVKVGLDNMKALLAELGQPQKAFKCVHVAGTNGKGSVCAIIESALRRAGYNTGLYTSPYLMYYNERIRIKGVAIDDPLLVECCEPVYMAAKKLGDKGVRPSAFELGTAVAFCAFRRAGVDVAVIEVGLGGRLDPTNVISPEVCAIASIGMDHTKVLGDTLEKIAREKAGILKPYTPAAIYPACEDVANVFRSVAGEICAPLSFAGEYGFIDLKQDRFGSSFALDLPGFGVTGVELRLAGAHQAQNARLAMLTLSILAQNGLNITRGDVCRGVLDAKWPGRLEWFGDGVLLDGCHNVDGARALADYIDSYLSDRRITLLTGMMSDKMPLDFARIIAPRVSRVITTKVDWDRAIEAEELAGIYASLGVEATAVKDMESALDAAWPVGGCGDILLVAGSLYLIGAIRRILIGRTGD